MLDGYAEEDNNGADGFQDTIVDENAAPRIVDSSDAYDLESNNVDVDYDKDDTDFEPDAGNPWDIEGDGLVVTEKGKPKPESDLYTAGIFWNFVDSLLAGARNAAKEQVNEDRGPAFEKAYSNILVQFLQQDLSEFSGKTKVSALCASLLGVL
ncbi:hypothetical protein BD769DRAFT_1680711 [Suillus cothurnatus]|nr:hypothetical protein BD769DRAFT_1680711 [Suillus cothurnatus]